MGVLYLLEAVHQVFTLRSVVANDELLPGHHFWLAPQVVYLLHVKLLT